VTDLCIWKYRVEKSIDHLKTLCKNDRHAGCCCSWVFGTLFRCMSIAASVDLSFRLCTTPAMNCLHLTSPSLALRASLPTHIRYSTESDLDWLLCHCAMAQAPPPLLWTQASPSKIKKIKDSQSYFIFWLLLLLTPILKIFVQWMVTIFWNDWKLLLPVSFCSYLLIFSVFNVTIVIRYCTLFYIVVSIHFIGCLRGCIGWALDSWSKGRWFDSWPGRYQVD